MKVLLAVPPRPMRQVLQVLPPLGLGYLAGFLTRAGHDVRLLDLLAARGDRASWRAALEAEQPELVGLGAFTTDLPTVGWMLEEVRRTCPGATTILGGPHASGDPTGTLARLPDLDLAFQGEGERGIVDLVEALAAGVAPDPARIRGLHARTTSGIRGTPPHFDPDLDALGFPRWDLMDPLRYQRFPPTLFVRSRPFAPIIVTRGCPYRCTFCAGHLVTGRTMRSRSVEHVLAEIAHLEERYGVQEIHIEDDNFTWDRDFVSRFCEALLRRRSRVTWTMPNGVRLETLDRELVRTMRRAGCYQLVVGIESGSQRILKHMRKALSLPLIEQKVRDARAEGMRVHGFFMLGYPEETSEDLAATLRLALRLDLTGANFHSFRPLPGTRSGEELVARGAVREWVTDPAQTSFASAVFAPAGLTPRRLKTLQRRMLARFYLRPRVLTRTLWDATTSGAALPLLRKAVAYLA